VANSDRALATDAANHGWAREVERHRCTADRIEKLLTDLGQPLEEPTGALEEPRLSCAGG
jgi:hypothetical protein